MKAVLCIVKHFPSKEVNVVMRSYEPKILPFFRLPISFALVPPSFPRLPPFFQEYHFPLYPSHFHLQLLQLLRPHRLRPRSRPQPEYNMITSKNIYSQIWHMYQTYNLQVSIFAGVLTKSAQCTHNR